MKFQNFIEAWIHVATLLGGVVLGYIIGRAIFATYTWLGGIYG